MARILYENIPINSTCEVYTSAINDDTNLTQALHTVKPCAYSVGGLGSGTSSIFQI